MLTQIGEAQGASTEWFGTYAAVSHMKQNRFLFFGHKGTESHVGARIIFDKLLTKSLLRQAGVPTPEGLLVQSPEEAISFREKIRGPIVIKPRFGMKGRGVTVNLRGPNEITTAFKRAGQFGDVLAEEYVANSIDYRCFATKDTCVSVVRRILPWVLGDGSSTIAELIEAKNIERQQCPSTVGTYIPVDPRTKRHLRRSKLTLESVLPAGQALVVRDIGGLSSGGEPYECSAHISDSVKKTVAQAVAAIPGLAWAGCDVLIGPDGVAQVIEVNSDAGIGGARYPFYGTPQPIDELLFKARMKTASTTAANSIKPLSALETPLPLAFSATEDDNGQARLPSLFHTYLRSTGWSLDLQRVLSKQYLVPAVWSGYEDAPRHETLISFTAPYSGMQLSVDCSTARELCVLAAVWSLAGKSFASSLTQSMAISNLCASDVPGNPGARGQSARMLMSTHGQRSFAIAGWLKESLLGTVAGSLLPLVGLSLSSLTLTSLLNSALPLVRSQWKRSEQFLNYGGVRSLSSSAGPLPEAVLPWSKDSPSTP